MEQLKVRKQNDYKWKEKDRFYLDTILQLVHKINEKDCYTYDHSINVARYSSIIAKELGCNSKDIETIYFAGLLHDVGKINTPDTILNKECKLTAEEFVIMKRHSEDGYFMVKEIQSFRERGIDRMVRHHHERLDGYGYPDGLKGDEIPFGVRILTVADSYDAIMSTRPYQQARTLEDAIQQLIQGKKSQFDEKVVDAFIRVLIRNETTA